jgi:hypothetical protein
MSPHRTARRVAQLFSKAWRVRIDLSPPMEPQSSPRDRQPDQPAPRMQDPAASQSAAALILQVSGSRARDHGWRQPPGRSERQSVLPDAAGKPEVGGCHCFGDVPSTNPGPSRPAEST